MLPVGASVSNPFVQIGNDITNAITSLTSGAYAGNFELGRLQSGEIRFFSNTGNNANNIISGEVGAAMVGDTRGLLDFSRTNIAQRSNFGKNAVIAAIVSRGIAMKFPPMPPMMQLTGRSVTRTRGNLISVQAITGSQLFFASHCASCTGTPAPTAAAQLPPLPWGAVPNFTVMIRPNVAISGAIYTTNVKVVHMFAQFGATGATVTTVNVATAVALSVSSNSTFDVNVPGLTGNLDLRNGIWVGALFYIDVPIASAANLNVSLSTWFDEASELELSNAFLLRADNVASGVTLVTAGTLFPQCVDSGISTAASNSVGMTPLSEEFTTLSQYEVLQNFMDDEHDDVRTVSEI